MTLEPGMMRDPESSPDPRPKAGSSAAEDLFPLVYEELRRIAASKLDRESPGQTLQPTALVHEAWLRLGAGNGQLWQNQEHYVAAAAEAMRRILVDRARAKLRQKRGNNPERVDFDLLELTHPSADQQILQVHDAVDLLALESPDMAYIVKLRFFAGLNHDEIGSLLGVNEKTVRRRWELARVRLFELIPSVS